jgi:hypothetical protein
MGCILSKKKNYNNNIYYPLHNNNDYMNDQINYCKICDKINLNIFINIHCLKCNKCHYKYKLFCNKCNNCYDPYSENDLIKHRKILCL